MNMQWKDVDAIDRFMSKTDVTNGCWYWKGLTQRGYGVFSIHCRPMRAHRFIYEYCRGKIPKGLVLDHLCRVKNCVNPSHLEAVTDRVNLLRGIGTAAINIRKTHCLRGHPLNGSNLGFQKNGRKCLTCRNYQAWLTRNINGDIHIYHMKLRKDRLKDVV
jgi:hypothetical protein